MTGTNLPVMSLLEWRQLLNDTQALLLAPKKHHRELLHHAYALRDTHAVDSGIFGRYVGARGRSIDVCPLCPS